MILSRDSVAVNADLQSDLGDFIQTTENLLWSDDSLDDRTEMLPMLLEDYNPGVLDSFRGNWFRHLSENLRSKLPQIMAQLLSALSKKGNTAAIYQVLNAGEKVEPYEGFCKEWMEVLKQRK
ncbi:hypothetical protein EWH99_05800 [Sporolactobacillus sp. THM7-7]|nr:hypothetical protein EWH99_05800 [Sporolactobacillus sp. THM7-7]